MRKIEFESLVTPSEFEDRCDGFVEEIEGKIAPKYPELYINSSNITKERALEGPYPEHLLHIIRKKWGKKKAESAERFHNQQSDLANRLSTRVNTAGVEIQWSGEKSKKEANKAIHDVEKTAQAFRGKRAVCEKDIEVDGELLPVAILHYDFTDETDL